ncbi:uncharacterized protein METZ01_LOCUS129124 [marine metagenome]|uniref:Uncharacterized protein n=1 Tax=marine metagenome TaxID=408172 RepID=A0A381YH54_9ZZZZ
MSTTLFLEKLTWFVSLVHFFQYTCYTLRSFSPLSPVSVLVSGDLDVKLLPENRISNIMMVFCVDVMRRAFFSCCKLLAK